MQEIVREYTIGNLALNPERIFDDPDYEERIEREERRQKDEYRQRRRENKKALRTSKLSGTSVCVTLLIIISLMFTTIYLQNEVIRCKKSITNLESEISTVNTLNDAKKSRIETATNLSNIRDRAIYDLGMVYATKEHVVYYEGSSKDFINLN